MLFSDWFQCEAVKKKEKKNGANSVSLLFEETRHVLTAGDANCHTTADLDATANVQQQAVTGECFATFVEQTLQSSGYDWNFWMNCKCLVCRVIKFELASYLAS